jgi:excisionase family DNA binding protein
MKNQICPNCNHPIFNKEILTAKEAAEFLGYSYNTIRSYICNRKIPFRGSMRRPRFFRSELLEWVRCGMPDNWKFIKAGKYLPKI